MTKRQLEIALSLCDCCENRVSVDEYIAANALLDDSARHPWLLANWPVVFKHQTSPNAELRSIQLFDTRDDRSYLFNIGNALPLEHEPQLMMFGKPCQMRRDVGFFAAPGISGYKYGGQESLASPLTPELQRLIELVNRVCGSQFNGILVNRYNTDDEYISPHSDNESNLSPGVGVVAISVGASRTMDFAMKQPPFTVEHFEMTDGSALCMYGSQFQQLYTHGIKPVPMKKRAKAFVATKTQRTRISFTFRRHELNKTQ